MSSTAFAQAVKGDPIVFLPIGACEAHGPHLPLGTDTYQPEWVVNEVARRVGGLIAPSVNYGQHSSTRNLPGTIGVTFDTLRSLVTDLLGSLHLNGVGKVVIVSGHLGSAHRTAIKLACEDAAKRLGMKVMMLSDYELAYLRKDDVCEGLEDGHGGIVETSRMMDIRPDLVSEERSAGRFVDSHFMVLPDPERCYPQGFAGDARRATREKGRLVNEYVVNELSKLVRRNFEG
jgi:creatinine amidohydrolase